MSKEISYRPAEQAVRKETEPGRINLDQMLVALPQAFSSRLFEELAIRNVSALDIK